MNPSIVRRKLAANEPVLAAKVNFMSPQIVEMVGMMGYDCLWICIYWWIESAKGDAQ